MANRVIFITFKSPQRKGGHAERRHIEAWRNHFEKHMFPIDLTKEFIWGVFVWQPDITWKETGTLSYVADEVDRIRYWNRMVQQLKNGGFMATGDKDDWNYCPAFNRPNRFIIGTWRIFRAFCGLFRDPKEVVVKPTQRAPAEQNIHLKHTEQVTAKKPKALSPATTVEPSSQKTLVSTSSHSNPRGKTKKQPSKVNNITSEGTTDAETIHFQKIPEKDKYISPETRPVQPSIISTEVENLGQSGLGGMTGRTSYGHHHAHIPTGGGYSQKSGDNRTRNLYIQGCNIEELRIRL
jgi:hypothetical protein